MTATQTIAFALIGVLIALVLFTCSHPALADDASRQLTPRVARHSPGVGTVQSADAGALVGAVQHHRTGV